MSALALVVSTDHAELERIASSLSTLGYTTNCVDSPAVASELVDRYANDYAAVVVDIASLTPKHEGFFGAIRQINPRAKIFATSQSDPVFWMADEEVVVCQSSELQLHLSS